MRFRFTIRSIQGILAVGVILALGAGPAAADGDSKLQIHGFLTQAWATADFVEGRFPAMGGGPAGPTAQEVALGIPEDGTFDYRQMAIQFRYQISDEDVMIVQLSSRALGFSSTTDVEDDVELDWAFYQRRLADNTFVKVGRVLIPYGIFNEIRDVGTILPFYRPPFVVYQEGAFTSETVDGLSFGHTFAAESDWSLQFDVYLGKWDLVEIGPGGVVGLSQAEESWGTQLWLNTPVSGLRFGAAYQLRNLEGVAFRDPGGETQFDEYLVSIDGMFNNWVLRAEYKQYENEPAVVPGLAPNFVLDSEQAYVQLGWHVTPKVRLYAQYETADLSTDSSVHLNEASWTPREDLGVSFNYVFSPNLVLKAEYHEVEGEDQTFVPAFGPAGFRLRPIYTGLDNGSYTILSLSASF